LLFLNSTVEDEFEENMEEGEDDIMKNIMEQLEDKYSLKLTEEV